MSSAEQDSERGGAPAGGGRRRGTPSSLFFAVLVAAVVAAVSGLTANAAKHPSYALHSNVVYRVEVGLALLAGLYVVALALWLAWYGSGFFKITVGPATAEAPGAANIEGAASEIEGLRGDFEDFRREASDALSAADGQVTAQRDRIDSVVAKLDQLHDEVRGRN